jgi:DNA-binding CsgD family transcriptional regulator
MTPCERLTPKEIQIAILVWQGLTNREIGKIVGTSEQVIKNHLRSAFDKIGVWSRLELAAQLRASVHALPGSGSRLALRLVPAGERKGLHPWLDDCCSAQRLRSGFDNPRGAQAKNLQNLSRRNRSGISR